MRKTNVKQFVKRGQTYEVWLGNGTVNSFTNIKATNKFFADTNAFLSRQIYELNLIFSDLQSKFRRDWFYFAKEEFKFQRKLQLELDACVELFDLIFNRSAYNSGNYFVFIDISIISRNLINLSEALRENDKRRSHTTDIYLLDSLKRRLLFLLSEVSQYSALSAKLHFEPVTNGSLVVANPPHLKLKIA
ncbi:MAG: hypothetical protein K9I36_16740 [Bacteroidia bacterium]|nr:hypothetical protein [Bacteroidia bacterium]